MKISDILTNVDFWQNVVLVATLVYTVAEHRLGRKESERNRYLELHSAYLSFVQYCLEHKELGLSEFRDYELKYFESLGGSVELLNACNVLVALWENAFLARASMTKEQWRGWELWMRDYLKRSEKVRAGVILCIEMYDPKFVDFVKETIKEIE